MDSNILVVKELSASYEDKQVLSGVSLTVPSGKIVCIVGESGSGKSTLLKAITGFKGLSVDGGMVVLEGEEITFLSASGKRKLLGETIGVIPQNPAGSFNPIRRYEPQIKETMESHGISYKKEEVIDTFKKMGLKDAEGIVKMRPYELSGGMNQRVAVAAAMLLKPKLLLCDEPTSALDVNTQDMVIEEFMRINNELGTTILMVTHNLGLARKIADKIAIMYKGKMIEQGDVDQIIGSPQEEYTKRLIEDVPKLA
ncbi:ATP-binding cassette domain-containing protein [Butyrivibrio sp. AE2032]|uniref:ATP-binding cassette domain-containing protein n=1 Tax=Butyrivibrio sp. AE2032 TaxID=1458463 RepID=UPI000557A5CF|nr:ABC transporter ATP-binding protein [Butyrivibrio sp. AE2032]